MQQVWLGRSSDLTKERIETHGILRKCCVNWVWMAKNCKYDLWWNVWATIFVFWFVNNHVVDSQTAIPVGKMMISHHIVGYSIQRQTRMGYNWNYHCRWQLLIPTPFLWRCHAPKETELLVDYWYNVGPPSSKLVSVYKPIQPINPIYWYLL